MLAAETKELEADPKDLRETMVVTVVETAGTLAVAMTTAAVSRAATVAVMTCFLTADARRATIVAEEVKAAGTIETETAIATVTTRSSWSVRRRGRARRRRHASPRSPRQILLTLSLSWSESVV
jgi:hypothetical protein